MGGDGMAKTERDMAKGLGVKRFYTTPGVHPYDEIEWDIRDAVIPNFKEGGNAFEQREVEFPVTWSQNATNIVAQKYFRGRLTSPDRERSVKQMIGRVVATIAGWGREGGYFATDDEAETFEAELKAILVNQYASFNSPVWFNVGFEARPQCSACFILSIEDSMESILDWIRREGIIFRGGSGSGVNLSRLRSSKEQLSKGGYASGPVSFMRGADASAGTIKSGGKTRRAAKMVVLDVDHPDVEEFIWCKAKEERKARVLEAAGYDMSLDSPDWASIQYQNANNSVRVTDAFMEAVEADADWNLTARTDGTVVDTVKARKLLKDIADAAWQCADPGVQYDTTINKWHTLPNTGRINASNPCSEYLSIDDSACNLASLNLMKFRREDGELDIEAFEHAVDTVVAQDGHPRHGRGRHDQRTRADRRGRQGARAGLSGRAHQPQGAGDQRDDHRPPRGGQHRRRADVADQLAHDRQDRGRPPGRRAAGQAVLPPRAGRQEPPPPRPAAEDEARSGRADGTVRAWIPTAARVQRCCHTCRNRHPRICSSSRRASSLIRSRFGFMISM